MSSRSAVLCLLVGCGRFSFEPRPDGPPPDGLNCPGTYSVTVPSSPTRYRVDSTNMPPRMHHMACASDALMGTHLAVFDTIAEQAELRAVLQTLPAPAGGRFYVGAVQLAGEGVPSTGWVWLTGMPVDPPLWRSDEPDDLDDVENALEQLSVIDNSGWLVDVSGSNAYGGVCECDGLALDPTAVAVIP